MLTETYRCVQTDMLPNMFSMLLHFLCLEAGYIAYWLQVGIIRDQQTRGGK